MNPISPFLQRTHIAYFSMEIALRPEIHTYSGGLGVLSGDTARSAADLELPMVFVSLASRGGYVHQEIDIDGRQVSWPDPWHPEDWTAPLDVMVAVLIEGREVWVRPWLYRLVSPPGRGVPVLLLDTDLDQNRADDRQITDHLYGRDLGYRLKQEIVLGIGGGRILHALGFKIGRYHLNEGHAALLPLYLLHESRQRSGRGGGKPDRSVAEVRKRCIFTTHTPLEAAFDKFPYPLVQQTLGEYVDLGRLKQLAGPDSLNMSRLAASLSGYLNGVSERYAQTAAGLFPDCEMHAITNGVHAPTWTHPGFRELFDASFPGWIRDPQALKAAGELSDEAVWNAHAQAKGELLALVKKHSLVSFKDDLPIIGFARRMAEYKRASLLFEDVDRLLQIARKHPFQVVFAGLAHPRDDKGQGLIEVLNEHIGFLGSSIPMVFLANYDMEVAAALVAGADIWLNTPIPPLEASGTSGMKAALNGVLNLSVLDGWWPEGHDEGVTGWAIGKGEAVSNASDAGDLYHKLEDIVLPSYYNERPRWIWMMKQSIARIGSYFNSTRMLRRYAEEAYAIRS
jgi:starch phosphorylase